MITAFLIILTVFDVALLGFIYFFVYKRQGSMELLQALSEERQILKGLKADFEAELGAQRLQLQGQLKKIMQIAAEVEQDANLSKANLASSLQELSAEFSAKLEQPMIELAQKQHHLDASLRKAEVMKSRLVTAIQRGEKICRFFHKEIPYEELLKDIELKKYEDARKLLTQGYSCEQVASDLSMRLSEVELIHGVALG